MTYVARILIVNLMTLIEPEKRVQVLNAAPKRQMNAEDTVKRIQQIAKKIREYSAITRETTKTLRESGVIPEFADAINEIASVVRDTAKEIHQTATELKESGVTGNIARSIKETGMAAQDTMQTVTDIANQVKEAAPRTSKAVRGAPKE